MQDGLTTLRHEAAVVHRFADFIEEYCKEQERSQRYIDASGEFFEYAEKLASGIKTKIGSDVKRASEFPPSIADLRVATLLRNIRTFKALLRMVHTLVKPTADAHTLTIPAPLIKLACNQLEQIEGMQKAKVVVLLTPQLMYFQRPHTEVKRLAARVETFIPDAKFPSKLGFIELPYSQGPSLFTNLAIYHEIGHFVYEELSSSPSPGPHFEALDSATNHCLEKFPELQEYPESRALAEEMVESWTQEIFCDLFALRLVGPAFTFALVEILAMLNSLSPETTVTFDQEHPAPACRFAEHVKLLRDDGWWDAISHIAPEQKKLVEKLAASHTANYKVDDGPACLLAPFLDTIIPTIRELVRQVTPKGTAMALRYGDERRIIEECLGAGVVPHNPPKALSPVSIINSAFCFYLTSFPSIVAEFEGPKAENDVETRSKWTKKLEDWTMKAIEDSQIRAQFEGMRRDGPFQERNPRPDGVSRK
jgi:hypothetical protein